MNQQQAVVALADKGAYIVLADHAKRPCWDGAIYSWKHQRPSGAVIEQHDGLFGIVPWSIRSTALDVDEGDPLQLRLKHPPFADLPTRRPGGHYLYFDDSAPRGNSAWKGYGCRGDLRGAAGYLVLWRDGAVRLLDALDARDRFQRPFPADLFKAAGMGALRPPAARPPAARAGGVRPDLIQPIHLAVKGCRNVSLFEHVRILADTTNRPRTPSGQIDVPAWIAVVQDMVKESLW